LSRTRFSFGSKISEDPFAQKLSAEASYMLKTVTRQDLADYDEMMNISRAGEVFTLEQQAQLRYRSVRSAQLASRTCARRPGN
jgi:hypothetical protein